MRRYGRFGEDYIHASKHPVIIASRFFFTGKESKNVCSEFGSCSI